MCPFWGIGPHEIMIFRPFWVVESCVSCGLDQISSFGVFRISPMKQKCSFPCHSPLSDIQEYHYLGDEDIRNHPIWGPKMVQNRVFPGFIPWPSGVPHEIGPFGHWSWPSGIMIRLVFMTQYPLHGALGDSTPIPSCSRIMGLLVDG